MNMFKSLIVVSVFLLSACSSLKDTAEPPTELKKIQQEVKFKKLWQANTGKGSGDFLLGLQPFVDSAFIYVSDYRGVVTAYDKLTGKKQWRQKLGVEISAAVGAVDGSLYLGGREGELIALNKTDGNILWQSQLSGEVLAAPNADLGMVVVQTSDGAIHGLASTTGEVAWTNRRTVPTLSLRGTSAPVVDNGLVVTGMANGRLLALSILDGRVVWEAPMGVPQGRTELQRMTDVDATPIVDDGLIYAAAYQGRTAAVARETGRILWARDISAYTGMDLDDEGSLFLGDENSQLWGLDKRNGATLWVQDKLRARHVTAPKNLHDYIVVGDFEGYVHVLSTTDGRLVGRKRYDNEGYITPPVVDGETVYMLDREGELTAFQLQSNKPN